MISLLFRLFFIYLFFFNIFQIGAYSQEQVVTLLS